MKKLIFSFLLIIFSTIILITIFLSTNGYETNRFNNYIGDEIKKKNPNTLVKISKIKIKLDVKKLNIFLSTSNTEIKYNNVVIPIEKIKIYINFLPLIKSDLEVNRIEVAIKEIEISTIQKLAVIIKPSNFKSFLLNNISNGKVKSNVDLKLDKNFSIINYKAKGYVENINLSISKKIDIKDANFNFLVGDDQITIDSISSTIKGISIDGGTIKIDKKNQLNIKGMLQSKVNIDNQELKKILSNNINPEIFKNKILISGNFLNKFNVNFNETLELKDYKYNLSGEIDNATFRLKNNLELSILNKKLSTLDFKKTKLEFNYDKKNKNFLSLEGLYNINGNEFENFTLKNDLNSKNNFTNLDFDISEEILINLLNYQKESKKKANIVTAFNSKKNLLNIKRFIYTQNKNKISVENLVFDKKNSQVKKIKKISINTFKDNNENNNFDIIFGKKIIIKGNSFDATNLIKNISNKEKNNYLKTINKEIEINLENIFTKLSIPLNKFNLLGKIEKGKFVKILSKSEFPDKKYLDISLKKDLKSKKKILEIFTNYPKALLADYNFFKGLAGGSLLYTSKFNDNSSETILSIEDFKVKNAPAFAKLLTLADLKGVGDLLKGDGISFEILEIKSTDNKELLTINEIYAVGPSISILMDGYVENKTGLISLRGTMVPAKELNKLISKIPVVGNILVGKKVGEGVFGVSFKIKGLSGNTKTTVNPIKTITPRFITRALEKRKKN